MRGILLAIIFLTGLCGSAQTVKRGQLSYPADLASAIEKAMSYYPELEGVAISFRYSEQIHVALMEAQPNFWDILTKPKEERRYLIYMSRKIKVESGYVSIAELDESILLGWLTHELGHIVDYVDRSAWNMVDFGFRYVLSPSFKLAAEHRADRIAVMHGCGPFLMATKNFILYDSDLPEFYKAKIRNFYLSPEEIDAMLETESEAEARTEAEP